MRPVLTVVRPIRRRGSVAQRNALNAALEISARRAERADAQLEIQRLLAERVVPEQREAPQPGR